nr:hypothetical protein [Tanacetum cinerariifolium]
MFPVTRSTRSTMSRAAHTTTNTPTTDTTMAAAAANISGHLHHPTAAAPPITTPHPPLPSPHHFRRRGGLWVADWPPPPRSSLEKFRSLAYLSMHGGAVRRQTTIVVAVGRWYNHHSRTMWCRAMAAQPLRVPRCALPFDATVMAATKLAMATTATIVAPWWCWACGGDSPFY